MKRIHILISGQVQGVFFRAFVRDKALSVGLKGYVRNTEDKNVEVVAEGHEFMLKRLVELCKKGPAGSVVREIKIKFEQFKGEFNTFRIKQ